MNGLQLIKVPFLSDNEGVQEQEHSTTSSDALQNFSRNLIDISFHNLSYTVDSKQSWYRAPTPKQILKEVSGIFKAAQITAIMGASGSGKTTLLNIVACKIMEGVSGELNVNTQSYGPEQFGNFANYAMQNDILLGTMTVGEALNFAADLKMKTNPKNRKLILQKLIKHMKLEKCINVLIGDRFTKGISGGQKKRTSIAFQVISNPQVFMLDEPTSGLDSLTAFIIVRYLKIMACQQKRTIILTIHQPSKQIFELFDRLLLLVQGRIVYQGEAQSTLTYFQKMGFECPDLMNPPEYLMSILHRDSQHNRSNYPFYLKTYIQRAQPNILKEIQECAKGEIVMHDYLQVPFSKVMSTLLGRDFHNLVRNPVLLKVRIFQTICLGLLIGGVFFQVGNPDNFSIGGDAAVLTSKLQSLFGGLFFLTLYSMMVSMAPVTLTFPIEKVIFAKQTSSRLYEVFPYFLSRNLVQLPYLTILPLLNALIVYFMMDLGPSFSQFMIFYIVMVGISFVGASFGLFIGSLFKDVLLSASLSSLFILPFIVFSGFFKSISSLPPWVGWIQYISPVRYAFVALVRNQFNQQKYEQILNRLGFGMELWECVTILFIYSMIVRGLSLACLYYLKTKVQ